MHAAETVSGILVGLSQGMAPWPDVSARLAEALPGRDVYLGGDGLRPYAFWVDGNVTRLMAVRRPDLPLPPLVADVLAGAFGPVEVEQDADRSAIVAVRAPSGEALARRCEVPSVLLIGLGDAERYRGARLALGVARLSQWLRFTHCARVSVIDYNVTAAPLDAVDRLLTAEAFDVVGVSVNFGQWQMLENLAAVVNKHRPPLVVLGNILAAFSPDRAVRLFDAADDGAAFVATGLGERPMERLCREYRNPPAWDGIRGLVRPTKGLRLAPTPIRVNPPDLVYPDDSLVLATAQRGGQISLETSFGCQYGACTFCPRDHKGDGWSRGHRATVVAALERAAPSGAVVSIVDEEFFGFEGLADPPAGELPAADILAACRRLGVSYEIYTRLEQVFDRRRSREWNLARARLLATEKGPMRRIFLGVESGSPSQLRRYGKGQTVAQTVDSLRVGSALGIPMEFGFITFDPLLTPAELAENISFLARRDVICTHTPGTVEDDLDLVAGYLDGGSLTPSGVPLYQHVAYMATELEVLAHSRYADHLQRRHPDLFDGAYDHTFARFGVRYRDGRIGAVAGWCRVWTEAMFTAVYEARMTARASNDADAASQAAGLVARYRDATFALLVGVSRLLLPEIAGKLDSVVAGRRLAGADPEGWLAELAVATLPGRPPVDFDVRLRGHRRDR